MPWVGFETTIPASERAKTVHALDRSATVTGKTVLDVLNILYCVGLQILFGTTALFKYSSLNEVGL
jgi:hypothetical protein